MRSEHGKPDLRAKNELCLYQLMLAISISKSFPLILDMTIHLDTRTRLMASSRAIQTLLQELFTGQRN